MKDGSYIEVTQLTPPHSIHTVSIHRTSCIEVTDYFLIKNQQKTGASGCNPLMYSESIKPCDVKQ